MSRTIDEIGAKLRRADEHLQALDAIVQEWAGLDPYMAEHRIEGTHGDHVYRLRFTREPDPAAAIVVGDFLNNLRSALDYLMVGLVPSQRRGKVHYPIFTADPFLRDPDNPRKYLERSPDARRRWKTYTEGVEPDPLRLIKEFQPFNARQRASKLHVLAALQSLSNSDKHRQISATPLGLESAQLYVNGEASDTISVFRPRVVKAGDELLRSHAPAKVQIEGTPVVLIRVGRAQGAPEIRADALRDIRLFVSGMIIGSLAGYLRR